MEKKIINMSKKEFIMLLDSDRGFKIAQGQVIAYAKYMGGQIPQVKDLDDEELRDFANGVVLELFNQCNEVTEYHGVNINEAFYKTVVKNGLNKQRIIGVDFLDTNGETSQVTQNIITDDFLKEVTNGQKSHRRTIELKIILENAFGDELLHVIDYYNELWESYQQHRLNGDVQQMNEFIIKMECFTNAIKESGIVARSATDELEVRSLLSYLNSMGN